MNFKAICSRKYSFACLVLVIITGAFTCASGQTTDENLKKLATANNIFALNLHRILSVSGRNGSETNVLFSPFSLSTVFGMLYYGVRGETAKELRQALGYDAAGLSDEAIPTTFHRLLNQISNKSIDYTFRSANAILVDENLSLRPEYKNGIQDLYLSSVREVNFLRDGSSIRQIVNKWVEEKTRGKIRNMLSNVDPMSALIILNAAYFKGKWKTAFSGRETRKENFYNGGSKSESIKVPMMNQKSAKFPYTATNEYQAAELPYLGDDISMLILLPKRRDGLLSLEQNLTSTTLDEIRRSMSTKKLELHLPRFKMEFSKSLPSQLQKLGISKIFGSGSDDFSGISANDSKKLSVSDVSHKSVIDVNEEGTEAAAATSAVMRFVSLPPKKTVFRVDHPFMFFIIDKRSGLIVFMGRITKLHGKGIE